MKSKRRQGDFVGITDHERAVNAVGDGGLERLAKAGLRVVPIQRNQELNHISRYEAGSKKIIGHVEVLDEGRIRPVTDIDENGFEIIYDSQRGYIFTCWMGTSNCGDLR
jgi:hypothetical protein